MYFIVFCSNFAIGVCRHWTWYHYTLPVVSLRRNLLTIENHWSLIQPFCSFIQVFLRRWWVIQNKLPLSRPHMCPARHVMGRNEARLTDVVLTALVTDIQRSCCMFLVQSIECKYLLYNTIASATLTWVDCSEIQWGQIKTLQWFVPMYIIVAYINLHQLYSQYQLALNTLSAFYTGNFAFLEQRAHLSRIKW